MGIALAVVLVAFGGAHALLSLGLARRRTRWRAVVAFLVPPLAPWWGWGEGLRLAAVVWGAALALYAVGVAVIGR